MGRSVALVTGATGFVGANLTRRLLNDGHEVHIITRRTSDRWRLRGILSEVNDHIVDLLNYGKLEKTIRGIRPQTIYHLATSGIYGGRHLPEKDLLENNFIGTFNMINACMAIDYKCFVNTGSSSEYGPKDKPMKETDLCAPVNMYGITKLASTLYAGMAAKTCGKPIVTLRLFSPFGPFDDPSRLISYAIRQAVTNKPIKLADPAAVRDYIYIDDVLDVYVKCMKFPDKCKRKIFNVGSGIETTTSRVVGLIMKITGSKSPVMWNAACPRPFDAKKWKADITRTRGSFSWNPGYSLEEGLGRAISWFRDNLSLYR